jgi:hypothetical protein
MAAGHPEHHSGVTRRHVHCAAAVVLSLCLATSVVPSAFARGVVAQVGQQWGQDLGGLAAQLLAQWIAESRQQMLSSGTRPVPPQIVQSLAGYFPPELLNQVRYRSGGSTEMSLPGLMFQYGDAAAITLVDVVMFRSEADAQTDTKLWAHELTHVMQYRRWGVDGFASRYVADSNAVEREAYGNADRYVAWRNNGRR